MPTHYTLDPARSRFTVQAFAAGMLSGFAHSPVFAIRRFGGEIVFSPDAPDAGSVQITVEAPSLELTDKVSDKDRQEIEKTTMNEVLEVTKYPKISFRSTSVAATTKLADGWFRVQLRGEMSLHGVTKTLDVDTQLRTSDGELRLSGEFPLSLTAFRVKRVSAVGGMIKVKDDLKFAFDLVGRPQEQTTP